MSVSELLEANPYIPLNGEPRHFHVEMGTHKLTPSSEDNPKSPLAEPQQKRRELIAESSYNGETVPDDLPTAEVVDDLSLGEDVYVANPTEND